MPMGDEAILLAEEVAVLLRNSGGYKVDVCFDKVKLGNMFKRATTKKAKYGIIIGENEVNNDSVIVKDLATQEQLDVKIDNLIDKFDELFSKENEEESK